MSKGFLQSKTNWFNALVLAVATILVTWLPEEYRAKINETALQLTVIGNIVLRTFFTSSRIKGVSKRAGQFVIVLLAVCLSACGARVYERSKATFATAHTTYAVAQRVVVQLRSEGIIDGDQWAELRPINDRIVAIDQDLLALYAAVDMTQDAVERDALLSEAEALLAEYVRLVAEVKETVDRFKKEGSANG